MRWQHPTRGLIGPEKFIPVAEETGLIRDLGWWSLGEACQRLKEWRSQVGPDRALIMSVNLSLKQFMQPNLVTNIGTLLSDLGLPSNVLKLEITESTVMEDPSHAVLILQKMKEMGIRLPIDDF